MANLLKRWWPGTELNRRRQPFQGCALPPELPGHVSKPAGPQAARTVRFTLVGAGFATERNCFTAGSVRNALIITIAKISLNVHSGFSSMRLLLNRSRFPTPVHPFTGWHRRYVDVFPQVSSYHAPQAKATIRTSLLSRPQSSSRTPPGCAAQCPTGLWQSMAFDLPSKRCRRCRDGSTASLRRIPAGTWRQ